MKTLHKLKISKLHNLEAGQLVKRNLDDLSAAGIDVNTDIHIKEYVARMQSDSNEFDNALFQIKKNEETAVIAKLDHERDQAFSSLNMQINVYRLSEDEAQKVAYQPLKTLLTAYKGLANFNFEAETNAIINLVKDLNSATYSPHVTTLNLGKFVTRLTTANIAFTTAFSQRSIGEAATIVYDSKLIRKTMIENYTIYTTYVLSLSNAANTPYYNSLLDIINNIRKYYSDLLARRTTTDTAPVAPVTPVHV